MSVVVVLNADYSFLSTISWQNAICLLMEGKAEAVQDTEKIIRNVTRTVQMAVPSVIRLVKYINKIFKATVPFSKRNVFVRDNQICAYCGTHIKEVSECTIDHIVPRAQGGLTTFENTVTACKTCNWNKADRTPQEAKMKLRFQPHVPSMAQHIHAFTKRYGIDTLLKNLYEGE